MEVCMVAALTIGSKVGHSYFGMGDVRAIEGKSIRVYFLSFGMKDLDIGSVQLIPAGFAWSM
jgi:hypothetical protein